MLVWVKCRSMHICMHVCMHVCTYVCMYQCMYVRMYVCMYVLVTILNATLSIESVDRATGGLLLLFDLIFLGGASQEFRTTRSHGMAYNAPPNPYSLGEDFDGSHGGPGVKKVMSRDWRGYGVFAEVAESAWGSYRYCFASVPSLPASLPSFSLHQPIRKLSLSLPPPSLSLSHPSLHPSLPLSLSLSLSLPTRWPA